MAARDSESRLNCRYNLRGRQQAGCSQSQQSEDAGFFFWLLVQSSVVCQWSVWRHISRFGAGRELSSGADPWLLPSRTKGRDSSSFHIWSKGLGFISKFAQLAGLLTRSRCTTLQAHELVSNSPILWDTTVPTVLLQILLLWANASHSTQSPKAAS